ncbi:hypothetical protein ABIF65_008203 [Bradyrhizobium japonicum]
MPQPFTSKALPLAAKLSFQARSGWFSQTHPDFRCCRVGNNTRQSSISDT